MMNYSANLELPKPLGNQFTHLKTHYPAFEINISHNVLYVEGNLQPTARSSVYHFRLKYSLETVPMIVIINPVLKRNSKGEKIPHMFDQKSLCVYYKNEFMNNMFLGQTIIPWANRWLYHYEAWHATGTWLGGGIEH